MSCDGDDSRNRSCTFSLFLFKQKMCGHLRLLNIACAAKAKLRVVTLTKPSREAPLAFTLLGGSEKGFRIFIDSVEPGSKAAEAGLKRGDQVKSQDLKYQATEIVDTVIAAVIWGYLAGSGNHCENICNCCCQPVKMS